MQSKKLGLYTVLWALLTFASLCVSASNVDRKGTLYIYEKSNIDGSNKGKIATYYLSEHVLESFKWHVGADQATKVRATMNPQTLDVLKFEAIRVNGKAEENKYAELRALPQGVFSIQFGDNQTEVSLTPNHWHSYDFDFADLSYAYQHYPNKKRISFHVFDIDMFSEAKLFTDFGKVTMTKVSKEKYLKRKAIKYEISGKGLDNRGGIVWFDAKEKHLLGFEIQKPDEPGYTSGKLNLIQSESMTMAQWKKFQTEALSK